MVRSRNEEGEKKMSTRFSGYLDLAASEQKVGLMTA
jgi:hypothetical protein